jgi:hypothetical protein
VIHRLNIKIEGTVPLVQHKFWPEVLGKDDCGKTVEIVTKDEWKHTAIYRPDTGQLYLNGSYFYATILNGARRLSDNIAKAIPGNLSINPPEILLDRYLPLPYGEASPSDNPKDDVYILTRKVRSVRTGLIIERYRLACSPGWKCTIGIEYTDNLDKQGLLTSLDIAGREVGIGDGRTIGYGRFRIVNE